MGQEKSSSIRDRLQHELDKSLSVQHQVVARFVDRLRKRRPDATPTDVIHALERQYLTAVTGTGAAIGASAAAPGVGTGIALAMSAGEIVTFFGSSALFCLAVGHVHGVTIENLERRRTLLLAVMLGDSGVNFVEKAAGRTGRHWGKLITRQIPNARIASLNKVLGRWFITKYGTTQGILVLGRIAPFGIGAAIGGAGNALVGRGVIAGARRAFGPPPDEFAIGLRTDEHDATQEPVGDFTAVAALQDCHGDLHSQSPALSGLDGTGDPTINATPAHAAPRCARVGGTHEEQEASKITRRE